MNVIELTIQPRKVLTMELTVGGGGASYYEGEYEVTPKRVDQTLPTSQKTMRRDVLVHEIPWWKTSNPYGKTYVIGE